MGCRVGVKTRGLQGAAGGWQATHIGVPLKLREDLRQHTDLTSSWENRLKKGNFFLSHSFFSLPEVNKNLLSTYFVPNTRTW